MNIDISKCRPFDGTKAKVGDVVVCLDDGDMGRILDVDRSSIENAVAVRWSDCVIGCTIDGRLGGPGGRVIVALPSLDPLDEIDPSPGNVAKLTRRQVGDGWRVKDKDERSRDPRVEYWNSDQKAWVKMPGGELAWMLAMDGTTMRVPITPTMVPLGPEDIVLGKTVVRTIARDKAPSLVLSRSNQGVYIIGCRVIPYAELQESYEISQDHGTTWQRAEKQEVKK